MEYLFVFGAWAFFIMGWWEDIPEYMLIGLLFLIASLMAL